MSFGRDEWVGICCNLLHNFGSKIGLRGHEIVIMNCEKTVPTFGHTVRLKGVWIRGYHELASKPLDLNRISLNEVTL